MNWSAFKSRKGSVLFWHRLASAAGSVERGLCLSVCASLAASAGGPFVRYAAGGIPRWDAVLPVDRKTIAKLLAWLFDESPEGDDPISVIRREARREGDLHFFHSPAILEALTAIVQPPGDGADAIRPGPVWWTGPVSEWKEATVHWLQAAGFDDGIPADRLSFALERLLDDLHRDHRLGLGNLDRPGALDAYVRKRYEPVQSSMLPFLRYDVLWADICRVCGLSALRPPASDPENARLRRGLVGMLAAVKTAGMHHLDYLRCMRDRAQEAGVCCRLDRLLRPTPEALADCRSRLLLDRETAGDDNA